MQGFHANPIAITSGGRTVALWEMKYDWEDMDFVLEVYRSENDLLHRYAIHAYSFIQIEQSLGKVILVYKTPKGEFLHEEVVDLKRQSTKRAIQVEEDTVISQLEHLIKQQMDFPSGTPTEIANHTEMLKKATMDKNARNYVVSKIRNIIVASNMVKREEVENYVYELYARLYGMGILQELDDDPEVGEIMVNAAVFPRFHSDIYVIKNGDKERFHKEFASLEELKQVFSRAADFNRKEMNNIDNAIIEATRANKDRVNIIIPNASENYVMNIRKFSNFVPNLEMMRKSGTVDEHIEQLMQALVKGKANIGIGGEMGTGKTTLINFLLTYTDPIERKVVIASVSETDVDRVLKGHDVVILSVDEEKQFTFERLIRASLRTTASRVVIPESRGSEFKQVYEANLKTKGNIFTAHALDDESFLDMCTDMYLSSSDSVNESSEYIKNKLAKSIDVIVIMRRVGNKIRIKSISEIVLDENRAYKGMNLLYRWVFDPENPLEGHYMATGNHISTALKERLNENGVPMSLLDTL